MSSPSVRPPGLRSPSSLAVIRRPALPVVVVALGFLVLAYAGQRGRTQSRIRVALDEIAVFRDQLQERIDGEPWPAESFATDLHATAIARDLATPPESTIDDWARLLSDAIQRLATKHAPDNLAPGDRFEFRLAQATLANARRQYGEATKLAPSAESLPPGTTPSLLVRRLRVVGDAHFGLQEWVPAAEPYRQILSLRSDHWLAHARLAECYDRLGSTNQFRDTLRQLAEARTQRAHTLFREGLTEEAARHYDKASDIGTRLLQRGSPAEEAPKLAGILLHLGHARMVLGKPDAAALPYEQASKVLASLPESLAAPESRRLLARIHRARGDALLAQGKAAGALPHYEAATDSAALSATERAAVHVNHGNALLALQRFDAAITQYRDAIERLAAPTADGSLQNATGERAQAHNNQGVVHRAQGRLAEASQEFSTSIDLLDQALARPIDPTGTPTPSHASDPAAGVPIALEVALGFAERSIDVLTRSRVVTSETRRPWEVALATSLRNRGYARVALGDTEAGLADFRRAVDVYSKLVAQEGQRDLAPQLAKSLNPLAWILATSADGAIRDGAKAKGLALKACQMTEWKFHPPIETLAAASAETGDFAAAVRWQEKALELAPAPSRPAIAAKRDLYRSGKPFRSPQPTPTAGPVDSKK